MHRQLRCTHSNAVRADCPACMNSRCQSAGLSSSAWRRRFGGRCESEAATERAPTVEAKTRACRVRPRRPAADRRRPRGRRSGRRRHPARKPPTACCGRSSGPSCSVATSSTRRSSRSRRRRFPSSCSPSCRPVFARYTTPHYVVCYNTSRTYAQWTSSLLERLYKAFTNYWEGQGIELHEPEFPLPVFVFAEPADVRPGQPRRPAGRHRQHHRLLQPAVEPHQHVRSDGRRSRSRRAQQPRLDARDQPDALAAGRRAAGGHDRSRSDAPNRVQLRPATALCRYPAVALRRHGRVLRSARPRRARAAGAASAA